MSAENTENVAGNGRVVLSLHGQQATFSQLSYCYPLKLLSPRVYEPKVAIAYILTYGGGLVSGDRIRLEVDVDSGAVLLLLTQGSTKVFKHRPGHRLAKIQNPTHDIFGLPTLQRLNVTIRNSGLLLLLPDPVTCFSKASYNQIQNFRLEKSGSAVLLDWITSGRMSRGEEWQFSRYYSINEVWIEGKRIARDASLLEEDCDDPKSHQRPIKDRLRRYACFATLILCGPRVAALRASLKSLYQDISVFQQSSPADITWSMSNVEAGCIIRVAGKETENVKFWLHDHLQGLEDIIGVDVYSKTFL